VRALNGLGCSGASLAGRWTVYDNPAMPSVSSVRWLRVLLLVLLMCALGPSAAARAAAPALDVAEARLENGLRVLVLEDHRSPVVSIQLWYQVGSRNERPGATGLAHFLEHMMFKGTPTHGKGEFSRMVEQNGGQDNAFTT